MRQAEAGEVVAVSVSGRVVAQLGPVPREQWRTWADIEGVFAGPADPHWAEDRDLVDQAPQDPFAP